MKYKILKTAFVIWVALWASFIIRELLIKRNFQDYKELLSRSLEGKRSYVTGDRLYEFLTFCNKHLPEGATYGWVGLKEQSIEIRRATYYLYPCLENDSPELVLVYNVPGAMKQGYEGLAMLDENRYIIRRVKTK